VIARLASFGAVLVALLVGGCASSDQQHPEGALHGIFTITGGLCLPDRGLCADGMSGVVTLTAGDGALQRIVVDGNDPLDFRLTKAHFSAQLLPGSYKITDQINRRRGRGSCPIFSSSSSFLLHGLSARISQILIRPGKETYVRINCPGW
jgi:hypothetical protein